MVRTKKAKILAIICTLGMLATMFIVPFTASAASVGVSYSGYQAKSWNTASDGAAIGHANKGLSIEALKVNLTGTYPDTASISYSIYENKGWHSAADSGAVGTANKKLSAEALKVSLSNMPGYSVTYSVYENKAWHTASDGAAAGNANKGYKIEAVKISISAIPTTAAAMSAVTSPIAVGGQTGFTFKDASGAAVTVDPSTVTWSVADATCGSISASGVFTAAKAGPASITATIGTTVLTATVNVSGIATGIKLSAASTSILADGTATDVITATVVDANGYTVTNFNGSATIGLLNGVCSGSIQESLSSGTLTFTNGIATVTDTAPNAVPSTAPTITPSALTPSVGYALGQNITYGTLVLTYTSASASTIGLSAASSTVSTDTISTDNIGVTLNDASGNAVPSGNGSYYVTFTLTGNALFPQTASQTLSAYVISGSTYTLAVNSEQGLNGTITVTASATGLATATTTISAVTTTAASKIGVTSTTGTTAVTVGNLPSGTTYTEYTVQLEDANGYAVNVANSGTDTLEISDNTSSTGGVLNYYSNISSGHVTSITSLTSIPYTGSYSFYVLNAGTATTNPTITVEDATIPYTTTASYTFVTAALDHIAFTTQSPMMVEPNQSISYSVQLDDVSGNALNTANQAISFAFPSSNTATATVNSCSSYIAYTNASGVATVTVAIPSSAAASTTYTLVATVVSNTHLTASATGNVLASLADYATAVGVASTTGTAVGVAPTLITWPTSVNPGAILTGDAVYALNSLNLVANTGSLGDVLQISSSNQAVIATGSTAATENVVGGVALTYSTTPSTAYTALKALAAGTATITIKDISNPTAPSINETITVTAGTPTSIKVVNPDNTSDANYTLPSTSGVSGAFTIELTDNGGNIVPATAPLTMTSTQVLAALGATGAGSLGIRTTATGSDCSTVTFAQGQSSMTVYLDGFTASYITGGASASTDLTSNTIAGLSCSYLWTAGTKTLVITTSNPVTDALTAAQFDTSTGVGSTVTIYGDTITVVYSTSPAAGEAFTSAPILHTAYGAAITLSLTTLSAI